MRELVSHGEIHGTNMSLLSSLISLSCLSLHCPHTSSTSSHTGGQILYQYRQRYEEPLVPKNCGKGYAKIKDLLLDMQDIVFIEQASGGHIVIRKPT
jgi:hypothetical protein